MATFPLTCATSMNGKPGRIPQATTRTISGASRTRRYGTVPVGATLSAEFLASSGEVGQVLDAWRETDNGIKPIDLPGGFFTGHPNLERLLPTGNRWYMSEPDFSPVLAGRCEVRVEFESRLEI